MDGRSAGILILIVTLVAHLAEEVKTGFRQRLPIGEMPLPLFVGLNVLLYLFCFTTLALSLVQSTWVVPLAWVLALSMALNGAGHIVYMLVSKRYFPGGGTAFLLLLAAGYLMSQLVR